MQAVGIFFVQALKVLRDSKLKPYIVFISPPTVEKIKRLRRGNMDSFNPNAKLSTVSELMFLSSPLKKLGILLILGKCFRV